MSSGTIEVGVSKNGAPPSGSIVIAPSLAKNVAICCCASKAKGAPGPLDVRQERMRVVAHGDARRDHQVVAEQRRPRLEVAGTNDRRGRRVRHGHVAARELENDRCRDERRVGGRIRRPAAPTRCCRSTSGSPPPPGRCPSTIGRFRNGMFSSKFVRNGSGAGLLYSEGDRKRSAIPTSDRNELGTPDAPAAISMIGPPATFGTPARMSGSRPSSCTP